MIRTVFVFLYVAVSMMVLAPIGVVAAVLFFLGPRKQMSALIGWICHRWGLSLVKLTGASVTVSGLENIPKTGGVCFVSNHDGYFDIVLLLSYCARTVGIIAKKELMFIPFLNAWIFIIGGLFIDRGSARKAVRVINRGVEKIKSGGSVVIFPEGHRSKGRGLLPFHHGSLKLAAMAEAPIIPIAIKGSYEVFEKNGRVTAASVKIAFLKPIDAAGDKRSVISDKVFSAIKDALDEKPAV